MRRADDGVLTAPITGAAPDPGGQLTTTRLAPAPGLLHSEKRDCG
ncbi:hypothetical protein ACFVP3_28355 [Streptomyces sp. NPDC057806]